MRPTKPTEPTTPRPSRLSRSRSAMAAQTAPISTTSPRAMASRRPMSSSSTPALGIASCSSGSHRASPTWVACQPRSPRRAGRRPASGFRRGASAIAGEQTGVYPLAMPGGWHLIGRTDARPLRSGPAAAGAVPAGRGRSSGSCRRPMTPRGPRRRASDDRPGRRHARTGPISAFRRRALPIRWSLHVANLLAGNAPGAGGAGDDARRPALVVREAGHVALTGADLGAASSAGGGWTSGRGHRLATGDVRRRSRGGGAGRRTAGARAYLALPGGIDVPVVLGSRATCLAGAFGGLDGRALRAGDAIADRAGRTHQPPAPKLAWPAPTEPGRPSRTRAVLRVLARPGTRIWRRTRDGPWRVGSAADRVGVRLDGDADLTAGDRRRDHDQPRRAVGRDPGARPTAVRSSSGADHQTTGGYRVPAVVISADRAGPRPAPARRRQCNSSRRTRPRRPAPWRSSARRSRPARPRSSEAAGWDATGGVRRWLTAATSDRHRSSEQSAT